LDQLRAARREAKKRSGEIAADLSAVQLEGEFERLQLRLASTPARTAEGMMAKLAFAAPYSTPTNWGRPQEWKASSRASPSISARCSSPAAA
jgi:hypothetical protein